MKIRTNDFCGFFLFSADEDLSFFDIVITDLTIEFFVNFGQ